jgi:hypothetical protein
VHVFEIQQKKYSEGAKRETMSKIRPRFDIREPKLEVKKENPFGVEATRIRQSHILRRSIVAALFVTLIIVFAARHITVINRFEHSPSDTNLILIAIKTLSPKKPPPPPKQKVIPPPVIKRPPDKVPDVIKMKKKRPPVRPKRRRPKKVKLKLNKETSVSVANRFSIGDLTGPDATRRRRNSPNGAPVIKSELRTSDDYLTAGPNNLDIAFDESKTKRKAFAQQTQFNLEVKQRDAYVKTNAHESKDEFSDFLGADVSVVLTSSDLSMGVEEYKLWNKINAEFDRWDKGRYGALPKTLTRKGRAIVATFQYTDGTAHRIVWLRGNTKLYIHRGSNRSRLEELEQAITAIIHLNTRKGRL